MANSILTHESFAFVAQFYTALGANNAQGMVDAMMSIKSIDYDAALKLRDEYRSWRAAQVDEGYEKAYRKFVDACEAGKQAVAAGHLSVMNQQYPQKFDECKKLLSYYFPKK